VVQVPGGGPVTTRLLLHPRQWLDLHLGIFIWANNNVHVICPVFVDDITFASKSKAKIAELKAAIAQHFKLHDLGPTTFQLGIEITCKRSHCTLHLLQCCYTQHLLER
jgi:hypothetical protein